MIPRSKRLSRRTFPTIRGKTLASGVFSLVYGPSSDGGCAAVVSKKVARRSVDRHLLKRRMLSVMRPYCSPSRYLVAYAKNGSVALSFKELQSQLNELLSHAS